MRGSGWEIRKMEEVTSEVENRAHMDCPQYTNFLRSSISRAIFEAIVFKCRHPV